MNAPGHHIPRLIRTIAIVALASGTAWASERWEVLQAIHWVENPRNSTHAGPLGELGPYQFRRSTWRAYSSRPFSYALQQRYSDEVAVQHYEWLKRGLQSAGLQPTPYNIALAWNAGLDPVVNDRVPSSACVYANQVNNLVALLRNRSMASAPEPGLAGAAAAVPR